jgi:hypothetical protein
MRKKALFSLCSSTIAAAILMSTSSLCAQTDTEKGAQNNLGIITDTYIKYRDASNEAITLLDRPNKFGDACQTAWTSPGILDRNRSYSRRIYTGSYLKWVCETTFKSASEMRDSSLKLGLPLPTDFGVFKLGLEMSEDSEKFTKDRKEWCDYARSEVIDNSINDVLAEKVGDNVASMYKTCMEEAKTVAIASRLGAYVHAVPEDTRFSRYTINLTVNPANLSKKPRISHITGLNETLACTYEGGKPVKTPFEISQQEISFSCTVLTPNGTCLTVAIEELGTTPPICLPTVENQRLKEIESLLSSEAAAISTLRRNYNRFRSTITERSGEVRSDTYGGSDGPYGLQVCPPGTFVVGIQAHDNDGGRFCGNCLTGVTFKCGRLAASD